MSDPSPVALSRKRSLPDEWINEVLNSTPLDTVALGGPNFSSTTLPQVMDSLNAPPMNLNDFKFIAPAPATDSTNNSPLVDGIGMVNPIENAATLLLVCYALYYICT